MAQLPGAPSAAADSEGPEWRRADKLPTRTGTTSTSEGPSKAKFLARLQGTRIEDLTQRDEQSKVFANPDGTWTAEVSSEPERVLGEDNQWHGVDTRLVEQSDGFSPAFTPTDLTLSNGGTQTFATLTARGRKLEWRWPSKLPTPNIVGDTATYSDALPGADLVVTATVTGFTHNIVLREAPATPVEFTLPVETDGAQLAENSHGGLSIETAAGKSLVQAPGPLMWDSSGNQWGESSQVVRVNTTIDQTSGGTQALTLAPDDGFLRDPDTVYPVTVDPSFTVYSTGDLWVQNVDYTSPQIASEELRAGSNDGGARRARSYLDFKSNWAGKDISSATLRLWNYSSGSCAAGAIRASMVTTDWAAKELTWGNQPSVSGTLFDDYAPAHGANNCNADDADFDVTEIVDAWAHGKPNFGVRLKAVDETSVNTWRKYRSTNYSVHPAWRPKLMVTYNSYPTTPTAVSWSNRATSGTVSYSRSLRPTFSATVSDADPGSSAAQFEISQGSNTIVNFATGTGNYVKDNSESVFTVPAGTLADGQGYRVRVRGTDGEIVSAPSAYTAFQVDTSLPTPVSVTSKDYPDDRDWHGNIGVAGSFTITPSTSDVVSVKAWLGSGPATVRATDGASVTVSLAPSDTGRQTLHAQASDAAGNTSDVVEHSFLVGDLDASSTSTLVDQIIQEQFSEVVDPRDDTDIDDVSPPLPPMDYEEVTPEGFVDEIDPPLEEGGLTEESDQLVLPPDSAGSITQHAADTGAVSSWDLPAGEEATPATLGDSNLIIYPNVSNGVDTVVHRTESSEVETYHLVRNPSATTALAYTPTLLPGHTLGIETVDNVAVVMDPDGNQLLTMEAPYAIDAVGSRIPVTLRRSGSQVLVSLTPAADEPPKYPILIDPVMLARQSNYNVTGAEKRWCANPGHWLDCYRAKRLGGKALTAAKRNFPDATLHFGSGDAFRHCYWSARLKLSLGHDDAYTIGTKHESESVANDKVMDLYNNKIGRWTAGKVDDRKYPASTALDWCAYYARYQQLYMVGSWLCSGPDAMTSWPTARSDLYWSHDPQVCASPR